MPQFRLTQKYAQDCRVGELIEPSPMRHLLDDWFIDVIRIQRKKVAMIVHAKSLFTFLLPYADIGGARNVPACLQVLLQNFLEEHELSDRYKQLENLFRREAVFCKTNDRRVLGHMNDFKRCLEAPVNYGPRADSPANFEELADVINQIPINFGADKYSSNPLKQFLKLLA